MSSWWSPAHELWRTQQCCEHCSILVFSVRLACLRTSHQRLPLTSVFCVHVDDNPLCTSTVETMGSHVFPLISPYLFLCWSHLPPDMSSFSHPIRLYKLSPPNPMFSSKSSLSSFIGPTSGMTKVKSLCSVEIFVIPQIIAYIWLSAYETGSTKTNSDDNSRGWYGTLKTLGGKCNAAHTPSHRPGASCELLIDMNQLPGQI